MSGSIRIDRDVPMRMRDGTVLRADVYRPGGTGRVPAILVRTPYNKDLADNGNFSPLPFAKAGYAVVIQDIRGRFASEGVWERHRMFEVEALDGYDSVEWIAAEPWCDGRVGLAGASYLTALQWIAAMAQPPHLKAFSPQVGDINTNIAPPRESGAVNFYAAANAVPLTAMDLVDRLEKQGEDVAEMRRYLELAERDPDWVLHYLPFKEIPLARFEPIRLMLDQRLNPPSWEEVEKRRRYERVTVPGLHIAGWFDQLESVQFQHYRRLRERAGSEAARACQHLLVGPWCHLGPMLFLGDMEFGRSAVEEKLSHHLRFFDRYLRDRDIGLPRVRYFVMGLNLWRDAEDWPPPGTRWIRFHLRSGGSANGVRGDGRLSLEEPGREPPDTFVYDPHNPVPTVGGRLLPFAGLLPGPRDQSVVEDRPDVLVYTSEELPGDLEVTGPLEVRLFVSTSAVDTDFTVKLTDVHPDGRSILIADGIQRGRWRNWGSEPELMTPGRVYEFRILLGNMSMVFRRGHRLRLTVSSSNFPLYDRNMNTGNAMGEDSAGVKAVQCVYHEAGRASFIELPVNPESPVLERW